MKMLTLMMIATMTVMAGATIAPALPTIQKAFHAVPDITFLTKLLLSITALFTAISAPVAGKLADRYGRRPIVLAAILIYGVAGSAGLYLESMTSLLISRAFLGIAVGALMTMATTLVTDYYQGDERTKMMGLKGGAASFGGVVFLSLGGILAEAGWRLPFYIYLFSFLVLPMAVYILSEPEKTQFKSSKNASIPYRKLLPIYALGTFSMMFFYLIPTQISFYLGEQFNADSSLIAHMISLSAVIGGVVASNYQRFLKIFTKNALVLLSWISMSVSFYILGSATSIYQVIISMTLSGVGYGLFMPSLNLMTADTADDETRGTSMGFLTTSLFLGQFLAPFFISTSAMILNDNIFIVASALLMSASIYKLGTGLLNKANFEDEQLNSVKVCLCK